MSENLCTHVKSAVKASGIKRCWRDILMSTWGFDRTNVANAVEVFIKRHIAGDMQLAVDRRTELRNAKCVIWLLCANDTYGITFESSMKFQKSIYVVSAARTSNTNSHWQTTIRATTQLRHLSVPFVERNVLEL